MESLALGVEGLNSCMIEPRYCAWHKNDICIDSTREACCFHNVVADGLLFDPKDDRQCDADRPNDSRYMHSRKLLLGVVSYSNLTSIPPKSVWTELDNGDGY